MFGRSREGLNAFVKVRPKVMCVNVMWPARLSFQLKCHNLQGVWKVRSNFKLFIFLTNQLLFLEFFQQIEVENLLRAGKTILSLWLDFRGRCGRARFPVIGQPFFSRLCVFCSFPEFVAILRFFLNFLFSFSEKWIQTFFMLKLKQPYYDHLVIQSNKSLNFLTRRNIGRTSGR